MAEQADRRRLREALRHPRTTAQREKSVRAAELERRPVRSAFSHFSRHTADLAGGPWAFALALAVVAAWLVTGPLFGFSDTWQLIINTGTTIVTFLMVFLLQHAQNKDTAVLHLKLNELIAAQRGASNHLIDLEDMDEAEVARLRAAYQVLADEAETKSKLETTSVEDLVDTPGSAGHERSAYRAR